MRTLWPENIIGTIMLCTRSKSPLYFPQTAHFFLIAFLLRPPAMVVAVILPFFRKPESLPSLGVAVPLPGASELTPDASSDSSSATAPSCPAFAIAPSRPATFPKRPVTRDRNHVRLIDGATAVSLSTGSKLPSDSS